jgi:hypothetical protein
MEFRLVKTSYVYKTNQIHMKTIAISILIPCYEDRNKIASQI